MSKKKKNPVGGAIKMKGVSPKSHRHARLQRRKQPRLDKLAEQREKTPETQAKQFHRGEWKGNSEWEIKDSLSAFL